LVVGEAGIYQKVILVDLEKAVKAIGTLIAGGHLGFQHCLRYLGLVGGAEAAPDGEGYERHHRSPRVRPISTPEHALPPTIPRIAGTGPKGRFSNSGS